MDASDPEPTQEPETQNIVIDYESDTRTDTGTRSKDRRLVISLLVMVHVPDPRSLYLVALVSLV